MMENKMEKKMVRGAVILTVTSFIVKVLSAVYRVPFQNLVGDEGFYVYQQIYPIYGIGMTLALSGLPVYLSKLIAAEEDTSEHQRIMTLFFNSVSVMSVLLFGLLFLGAEFLAKGMGDALLSPLIRVVSFVFVLVPFLSSYRGYYQGQLEMVPTAVSQLMEQGVRVVVILASGYVYVTYHLSVYKMGTLATSGALIGGLCGLFVLYLYGRNHQLRKKRVTSSREETITFVKRFIMEGGTLCFFSAYLVIFQLVDSFTIKQYLEFSGMPELSAKISKGVFDRGQPLVQLGLVVAVAMTATFLPTLTKSFIFKDMIRYLETARAYLRVSLAIASAAGIGLMLTLPYINVTLFSDNSGELTLCLFVLSIFFVSMIQGYQTIYQSQNHVRFQFIAAVIGLVIKGITTPLLTYYFGTVGSSISTLLGLSGCLLVLQYVLLKREPTIRVGVRFMIKLIGSLGVMIVVLVIYRIGLEQIGWLQHGRLLSFVYTCIGVLLGLMVYLICLIQMRLFTKKEWLMIPFGKNIVAQFY